MIFNEVDSVTTVRDPLGDIQDSLIIISDINIKDTMNVRIDNVIESKISAQLAFDKIMPLKVCFKFAKTETSINVDSQILKLHSFMLEYPNPYIIINGHTDSVGSEGYNIELSRNRAKAIKKILIAKGILPKRIQIKAYGESAPIDTNSTEEGRANNRRVEFKLKK